jgi:hypothetical protein
MVTSHHVTSCTPSQKGVPGEHLLMELKWSCDVMLDLWAAPKDGTDARSASRSSAQTHVDHVDVRLEDLQGAA